MTLVLLWFSECFLFFVGVVFGFLSIRSEVKVFAPPWMLCPTCLTSNRIDEYNDLLEKTDFAATHAQRSQRLGRVGRVKLGAYVAVEESGRTRLMQSLCCSDALRRVHALSYYHEEVTLDRLVLCPVSKSLIEEASEQLMQLQLSDDEMWVALTNLSLSLKDAKSIFKARSLDVGYEVAAVLAMKCVGQWKMTAVFDVPSIVSQLSRDHGAGWDMEGVKKSCKYESFSTICNGLFGYIDVRCLRIKC